MPASISDEISFFVPFQNVDSSFELIPKFRQKFFSKAEEGE